VAHPDLVPVVLEIAGNYLGDHPNQKERLRGDVQVVDSQITAIAVPGGTITEAGLRLNISVALQYLNAWLLGNGAAAINNLMEDAATAEISRSQIWQWIRHAAVLDDGRAVTRELYAQLRDEELAKLGGRSAGRYADAVTLLDRLCLDDTFVEFLTLIAYDALE
jgi:malate synthase